VYGIWAIKNDNNEKRKKENNNITLLALLAVPVSFDY